MFKKIEFNIDQSIREDIEEQIKMLTHDLSLEDIHSKKFPSIPDSISELLKFKIPDIIEKLREITDDPYTYLLISNAPIAYPFSQNNNRHPICECFQHGLLRASRHTIDAPLYGKAFVNVTPRLGVDDDSLLEEESGVSPFSLHNDGANYIEYSSAVCLAYGTGDDVVTSYVDLGLALEEITKHDVSILKQDIFEQHPGDTSSCLNIIKGPLIDENSRPKFNLTEGRTKLLEDSDETKNALNSFVKACNNNLHQITFKTGQVAVFSGEIIHGRDSFTPSKTNPRFAVRLRGTSEKMCAEIREKNHNLTEPHYPGL